MAGRKSATLSVGEAARRLGISPDTVRNYCERGLLQFARTSGNHRRILVRSIEGLERQKNPSEPTPSQEKPRAQQPKVDEDIEIYYEGNNAYPNGLEPGFVCTMSFLACAHNGGGISSMAQFLLHEFGGGTFRIARVRDGFVLNERVIELPGTTKDLAVIASREIGAGPDW